MTDNLDAWVEWGNANLPDWHGERAMPGPNEMQLNLINGVEYITVRADDFRDAMRIRDDLQAEGGWLRRQNEELHRQIDYARSLVWDDISDREILINLRHMLDRPKA